MKSPKGKVDRFRVAAATDDFPPHPPQEASEGKHP